MSTKIKICGLTRPEDVEAVNKVLPDYVGFVFASESSRYCTNEQASILSAMLHSQIIPVGVFVNADINDIITLFDQSIIRMAQLHGRESDEYIRCLKIARPLLPIIRMIPGDTNLDNISCDSVDYFLFDSDRGGSGKTFDWSKIKKMERPFFLAGGIKLDNALLALRLQPFAIDVSSGVETNGYKDAQKIKELVSIIRNSESICSQNETKREVNK
ncbi:MAG: phosphoribosylanthranilate isomerase [Christensenellaceae bacterium]|jgi:phosphoribosylanthranilate isomerase|nr:phosphoribosylanthranilate isomerase [Christensenellaceae bacterium]